MIHAVDAIDSPAKCLLTLQLSPCKQCAGSYTAWSQGHLKLSSWLLHLQRNVSEAVLARKRVTEPLRHAPCHYALHLALCSAFLPGVPSPGCFESRWTSVLRSVQDLAGDMQHCTSSASPVLASRTCPCPIGCARQVGNGKEKTICCLKNGLWGRQGRLCSCLHWSLVMHSADLAEHMECMIDSRHWLCFSP